MENDFRLRIEMEWIYTKDQEPERFSYVMIEVEGELVKANYDKFDWTVPYEPCIYMSDKGYFKSVERWKPLPKEPNADT